MHIRGKSIQKNCFYIFIGFYIKFIQLIIQVLMAAVFDSGVNMYLFKNHMLTVALWKTIDLISMQTISYFSTFILSEILYELYLENK